MAPEPEDTLSTFFMIATDESRKRIQVSGDAGHPPLESLGAHKTY
jgi:hypothetical protein